MISAGSGRTKLDLQGFKPVVVERRFPPQLLNGDEIDSATAGSCVCASMLIGCAMPSNLYRGCIQVPCVHPKDLALTANGPRITPSPQGRR